MKHDQLRRLRVFLACNDEQGSFSGRVRMAQIKSLYRVGRHQLDAELTHDDWLRGAALTVDDTRMKLRMHRVWFPFRAHSIWQGNMGWDSFDFDRDIGKSLLHVMRKTGDWSCDAGPSLFYRMWNQRPGCWMGTSNRMRNDHAGNGSHCVDET